MKAKQKGSNLLESTTLANSAFCGDLRHDQTGTPLMRHGHETRCAAPADGKKMKLVVSLKRFISATYGRLR
jgi:hypothetical protein